LINVGSFLFRNRDLATNNPVRDENLPHRPRFRSLEPSQPFAIPLDIAREELHSLFPQPAEPRKNRGLEEPQERHGKGAQDPFRGGRGIELSQHTFRDHKNSPEVDEQPTSSSGLQDTKERPRHGRGLRIEPEQLGRSAQDFLLPGNRGFTDSQEYRSLTDWSGRSQKDDDQPQERSISENFPQNDPAFFR
jgi:hypothetical protein